MQSESVFVGSIALVLAVSSLAISIGPWRAPYELKTIARIESRYGMIAARSFWVVIAAVTGILAALILSGWRPAYASSAVVSCRRCSAEVARLSKE